MIQGPRTRSPILLTVLALLLTFALAGQASARVCTTVESAAGWGQDYDQAYDFALANLKKLPGLLIENSIRVASSGENTFEWVNPLTGEVTYITTWVVLLEGTFATSTGC